MTDQLRNRGLMIALAYLWALALIPLFVAEDADVKWHAKHGLVLTVAEFVLLSAYAALTTAVSVVTLGLGFLLVLALPFAWMAIAALHVIAIVKAMNGGRLMVPGVSEFANRF
jgi:hypothetical protein